MSTTPTNPLTVSNPDVRLPDDAIQAIARMLVAYARLPQAPEPKEGNQQ